MNKKLKYTFRPDFAVVPGETLSETILALGMDQKELAIRTGLTPKTINQIIKGKGPITAETAVRLERVTGVGAKFWSNLEANYREQLTRLEDERRLKNELEWLKKIPVKELVKRGVVEPAKESIVQLKATLQFFGVNNPENWNTLWMQPTAYFRQTTCFKKQPGATATWLRLGEIESQKINTQPFNREVFKENLKKIRKLTTQAPTKFEPKMKQLCTEAGVVLVFIEEVTGCRASGAMQWLTPTKPLIQMNLRYRTNDHFWFTFFHEAAHVLSGSKKSIYIDDDSLENEEETQANKFATETLIPAKYNQQIKAIRTTSQILHFAREIEIDPGIVVGRLQHEQIIRFSQYNHLKSKFDWARE